jgi:hypothetical protein
MFVRSPSGLRRRPRYSLPVFDSESAPRKIALPLSAHDAHPEGRRLQASAWFC